LDDICSIETGKRDANEAVEGAEYLFFTTSRDVSRIDTFRWDTEALLIAGNANVGEVKHYVGKFEAYQRTYVLSDFVDAVIPRFLFYVAKSELKQYLMDKTNSAAMTYIVLGTLKNFPIPIPPIEVQREIVSILDIFTGLEAELEAELEARRKQYEHYQFKLMWSDDSINSTEIKNVKDVCIERFWLMPATPKYIENGEIPYVTSKNLRNGEIDFTASKFISRDSFDEISKNRSIEVNDILIGMIGTIGEIGRVKESDPEFYGQNMYLLRLNQDQVNPFG
jgi:type I restriction enzyme S subunit